MPSILNAPYFQDETAAYAKLESIVWPSGPVCPHCGSTDRMKLMGGSATRPGLYKCYACRKQSRVTVGTIFESSHIKLHAWLQASFLICSSKKGISSNQLARVLGLTVKSAWFMSHRLREAMRTGGFAPFGQSGGDVEVDETFVGTDPNPKSKAPWAQKNIALSLVDRTSGRARSFVVDDLSAATITPILEANISREARLITDEAPRYIGHGRRFAAYGSVNHHKEEYVSLVDPTIHTNTIEGYFSIFKRGMKGVYQHCAKRHLHRYMAEFDFRYSNRVRLGIDDMQRTVATLEGVVGKRLTYRRPDART